MIERGKDLKPDIGCKNVSDCEIIKETQLLFKNFLNAVNLFTVDENYDRIHYCIDHSDNSDEINTYGKKRVSSFLKNGAGLHKTNLDESHKFVDAVPEK